MRNTNPNLNTVSTVWLSDGRRVSFEHRDTTVGWVNGLKRRGVDPRQVVKGCPGLPEEDRV